MAARSAIKWAEASWNPVTAYRRSGAVILLAAITAPIWNVILVPLPEVSLTFGRGVVLLSALLLVLDSRRAPDPRPAVPRAVWLLLAALTLLWTWTVVNALTWGCRCAGEIAGFSELVAMGVLAALVAAFEPRLRPAMVLAVVAGASLSAALTLAGVQGLSAGAANTSTLHGRVAGPYGNPNLLALALAFAVPAGLAAYRLFPARARLLLAGALGLVGVVLLLTFSRGGLLAAAAGAVVVLVLQHPRRSRARRRTTFGLVALLAATGVAYPFFAELRRDASSPGLDSALRARDLSGWDAGTQGLIPMGPATIVNPARDELEVQVERPGQGVSRGIGPAATEGAYEVRFEARTVTGTERLSFGVEDNVRGNGPAVGSAAVSEQWRPLRVRWRPTGDSPDARLYIWSAVTAADFRIRDVLTVARQPGGSAVRTALPVRLQGSAYAQLEATRRSVEAREIASRRVGVELSLTAFASQPVRGIGWGRFNDVAAARSDFGRLPTHNEYLRFLAELGGMGILLLGLVVLIIGSAVRRAQRDEIGLALLGMLVTGGVGLVFVNGLATPAVTMPLAFAAAAACARSGQRAPAVSCEATGWWPTHFGPRRERASEWALAWSWGVSRLLALRGTAPAPSAVILDPAWGQRRFENLERVLRALVPGLVRAARESAPAIRESPTLSPTVGVRVAPAAAPARSSWPLTRSPRRARWMLAGVGGGVAARLRAASGRTLLAFRALRGAAPRPERFEPSFVPAAISVVRAAAPARVRAAPATSSALGARVAGAGRAAAAPARPSWPLTRSPRRARWELAGASGGVAARLRAASGRTLLAFRALRGAAPRPERFEPSFVPAAISVVRAAAPACVRAAPATSSALGARVAGAGRAAAAPARPSWPLTRSPRRARWELAGASGGVAARLRAASGRTLLAFRALRGAAPRPERFEPSFVPAAAPARPSWPLTRSPRRARWELAGASGGVAARLRAASGRTLLAFRALRGAAPRPERFEPPLAKATVAGRLRCGAPALRSLTEPEMGARLVASLQRLERRAIPPLNAPTWREVDLTSEITAGPGPGAPPELPMTRERALRAAAPPRRSR